MATGTAIPGWLEGYSKVGGDGKPSRPTVKTVPNPAAPKVKDLVPPSSVPSTPDEARAAAAAAKPAMDALTPEKAATLTQPGWLKGAKRVGTAPAPPAPAAPTAPGAASTPGETQSEYDTWSEDAWKQFEDFAKTPAGKAGLKDSGYKSLPGEPPMPAFPGEKGYTREKFKAGMEAIDAWKSENDPKTMKRESQKREWKEGYAKEKKEIEFQNELTEGAPTIVWNYTFDNPAGKGYGSRSYKEYQEAAKRIAKTYGLEEGDALTSMTVKMVDAFDLIDQYGGNLDALALNTPEDLRPYVMDAAVRIIAHENKQAGPINPFAGTVAMMGNEGRQFYNKLLYAIPGNKEAHQFRTEILGAVTDPERYLSGKSYVTRQLMQLGAALPTIVAAGKMAGSMVRLEAAGAEAAALKAGLSPGGAKIMGREAGKAFGTTAGIASTAATFGTQRALGTAMELRHSGTNWAQSTLAGLVGGTLETAIFSHLPQAVLGTGAAKAVVDTLAKDWKAAIGGVIKRYVTDAAKTGAKLSANEIQQEALKSTVQWTNENRPDLKEILVDNIRHLPDTAFAAFAMHVMSGLRDISTQLDNARRTPSRREIRKLAPGVPEEVVRDAQKRREWWGQNKRRILEDQQTAEEALDALKEQITGPADGSGGAQSGLREEGGSAAKRSERVQPSGQGDRDTQGQAVDETAQGRPADREAATGVKRYTWEGMDAAGNEIQDFVEASSAEEAVRTIRKMGYMVFGIVREGRTLLERFKQRGDKMAALTEEGAGNEAFLEKLEPAESGKPPAGEESKPTPPKAAAPLVRAKLIGDRQATGPRLDAAIKGEIKRPPEPSKPKAKQVLPTAKKIPEEPSPESPPEAKRTPALEGQKSLLPGVPPVSAERAADEAQAARERKVGQRAEKPASATPKAKKPLPGQRELVPAKLTLGDAWGEWRKANPNEGPSMEAMEKFFADHGEKISPEDRDRLLDMSGKAENPTTFWKAMNKLAGGEPAEKAPEPAKEVVPKAAQPESDQDVSYREWRENFEEVSGDPENASDKNLHRAIHYASRAADGYRARGEMDKADSMQREADWYRQILKQREKDNAEAAEEEARIKAEGTAAKPAPVRAEGLPASELGRLATKAREAVGKIVDGLKLSPEKKAARAKKLNDSILRAIKSRSKNSTPAGRVQKILEQAGHAGERMPGAGEPAKAEAPLEDDSEAAYRKAKWRGADAVEPGPGKAKVPVRVKVWQVTEDPEGYAAEAVHIGEDGKWMSASGSGETPSEARREALSAVGSRVWMNKSEDWKSSPSPAEENAASAGGRLRAAIDAKDAPAAVESLKGLKKGDLVRALREAFPQGDWGNGDETNRATRAQLLRAAEVAIDHEVEKAGGKTLIDTALEKAAAEVERTRQHLLELAEEQRAAEQPKGAVVPKAAVPEQPKGAALSVAEKDTFREGESAYDFAKRYAVETQQNSASIDQAMKLEGTLAAKRPLPDRLDQMLRKKYGYTGPPLPGSKKSNIPYEKPESGRMAAEKRKLSERLKASSEEEQKLLFEAIVELNKELYKPSMNPMFSPELAKRVEEIVRHAILKGTYDAAALLARLAETAYAKAIPILRPMIEEEYRKQLPGQDAIPEEVTPGKPVMNRKPSSATSEPSSPGSDLAQREADLAGQSRPMPPPPTEVGQNVPPPPGGYRPDVWSAMNAVVNLHRSLRRAQLLTRPMRELVDEWVDWAGHALTVNQSFPDDLVAKHKADPRQGLKEYEQIALAVELRRLYNERDLQLRALDAAKRSGNQARERLHRAQGKFATDKINEIERVLHQTGTAHARGLVVRQYLFGNDSTEEGILQKIRQMRDGAEPRGEDIAYAKKASAEMRELQRRVAELEQREADRQEWESEEVGLRLRDQIERDRLEASARRRDSEQRIRQRQYEAAHEYGVEPKKVEEVARNLAKQKNEYADSYNQSLADLIDESGLTARDVRKIRNGEADPKKYPGLDAKATYLARQHTDLGLKYVPEGAEEKVQADDILAVIQKGPERVYRWEDFIEEAATGLAREKGVEVPEGAFSGKEKSGLEVWDEWDFSGEPPDVRGEVLPVAEPLEEAPRERTQPRAKPLPAAKPLVPMKPTAPEAKPAEAAPPAGPKKKSPVPKKKTPKQEWDDALSKVRQSWKDVKTKFKEGLTGEEGETGSVSYYLDPERPKAEIELFKNLVELAKAAAKRGVASVHEWLSRVRKEAGEDMVSTNRKMLEAVWGEVPAEERKPKLRNTDINSPAGREELRRFAKRVKRAYIEGNLAATAEEVLDAVHQELLKVVDNPQDWQLWESRKILLNEARLLPDDPASRRTREITGELNKLDNIDDILSGHPHQLRGDLPKVRSERQRQLEKELHELKKKHPELYEDAIKQRGKSILESKKTAIANVMRDMEREMKVGKRDERTPTESITDPEYEALREKYQEMRQEWRKQFPKQPHVVSMEKRIEMANNFLDKIIAYKTKKLMQGDIDPEAKKEPLHTPELDAKRAKIQAINKFLRDLRKLKEPKKTLRQKRIEAKERAMLRELNKLRKEVRRLEPTIPPVREELRSALIDQRKSEIKALKAERDKVREASGAWRAHDDARFIQNYRAMLLRQLTKADAKLVEMIRTGKLPEKKVPRIESLQTPDIKDARFALHMKNKEIEREMHKIQRASRELHQKIVGAIPDTLNASRQVITAYDLSASGRQAFLAVLAHPVMGAKAFAKSFANGWTQESFQRDQLDLRSRATAAVWEAAKLGVTETDGPLEWQEEVYMGEWGRLMPGVKWSERMYVGMLNHIRADLFDSMYTALSDDRGGDPTIEQAKHLADYVNVVTGRGSIGDHPGAARFLSTYLFSPRYMLSRMQFLVGKPLYMAMWHGDWASSKIIATEYVKTLAAGAIMYGSLSLAANFLRDKDGKSPFSIEWNPGSSDFGKIRFGNTRIDPMAGLSQTMVFLYRVFGGTVKTLGGEVRPIRGPDVPYGGRTVPDELWRFFRSKMSPSLGAAANFITGKNAIGQDYPSTKAAALDTAESMVFPLIARDVWEAWEEQGFSKGTAMGIAAFFGMGLQTFQPYPRKGSKSAKSKGKKRPRWY